MGADTGYDDGIVVAEVQVKPGLRVVVMTDDQPFLAEDEIRHALADAIALHAVLAESLRV